MTPEQGLSLGLMLLFGCFLLLFSVFVWGELRRWQKTTIFVVVALFVLPPLLILWLRGVLG